MLDKKAVISHHGFRIGHDFLYPVTESVKQVIQPLYVIPGFDQAWCRIKF
jgi:hypothetical protein